MQAAFSAKPPLAPPFAGAHSSSAPPCAPTAVRPIARGNWCVVDDVAGGAAAPCLASGPCDSDSTARAHQQPSPTYYMCSFSSPDFSSPDQSPAFSPGWTPPRSPSPATASASGSASRSGSASPALAKSTLLSLPPPTPPPSPPAAIGTKQTAHSSSEAAPTSVASSARAPPCCPSSRVLNACMCTLASADRDAAAALASSSHFNAGGKVATAVLTVAGGAHSGEDGNCCGMLKKANAAAARSECLMPVPTGMRICNSLEEAQRTIVLLNRELAAFRAQSEEKPSIAKPSASDELKHTLIENAKLRADNQRLRAEHQKMRSALACAQHQMLFKQDTSAAPTIDRKTML